MACTSGPSLNKTEYAKWIENPLNEAIKSQEDQELKLQCQFLPSDYIILRELANGVLDETEIERRRKELEGQLNFKISITNQDGSSIFDGNPMKKTEKEAYLRNEAQQHIILKTGDGKTHSPAILQLIRNYGIKAETDLMLAFENIEQKEFNITFKSQMMDTSSFSFDYNLNKIAQLSH